MRLPANHWTWDWGRAESTVYSNMTATPHWRCLCGFQIRFWHRLRSSKVMSWGIEFLWVMRVCRVVGEVLSGIWNEVWWDWISSVSDALMPHFCHQSSKSVPVKKKENSLICCDYWGHSRGKTGDTCKVQVVIRVVIISWVESLTHQPCGEPLLCEPVHSEWAALSGNGYTLVLQKVLKMY